MYRLSSLSRLQQNLPKWNLDFSATLLRFLETSSFITTALLVFCRLYHQYKSLVAKEEQAFPSGERQTALEEHRHFDRELEIFNQEYAM